jgi:hypothetical protein
MSYQLLTVDILRDIARRYGLIPTGNRQALEDRIRAFDMANQVTPAAVWDAFTEAKLTQFCDAMGVDITNAHDKAAKVALLATLPGLAPHVALQAIAATPQRQPPTRIELQLVKQGSNERPDAFLERARTHFQLVQADDAQAITLLINAAQPSMAAFVAQQFAAGTNTIEAMFTALQTRFTPNRYQYHHLFHTYKMSKDQTAQEIGAELKRLYLGFLQLPAEIDLADHDIVITPTLTARLIQVLPTGIATTLRTETMKNTQMTWDEVLLLADQLLQGATKEAKNLDAKQEGRSRSHCSIHGYGNHTDAQCYQQQRTGRQDTSAPCYQCQQIGHAARNCPLRKKGNDNTGSG